MVEEINNKIAFCVVSTNNSYVYKAIITLLSVKENNKEHKEFEYFVCGNFSNKYKKAIEKYNLKVLNINLGNIFKQQKSLLPQEIFWISAVPETLYEQGFKYSIILDGDIFCIKEVPINILNEVDDFGFLKVDKLKDSALLYLYKILLEYDDMKEFNLLEERDIEEDVVNSGVGIFNNESLTQKRFKETFIEFYEKAAPIIHSNSDAKIVDEFIFFLLKTSGIFHFRYISEVWNKFISGEIYFGQRLPENKLVFLHLQYKPWKYKFYWRHPKINPKRNIDDIEIKKFNERRTRYRELYINFCKKIYKHKYYIYYFEDVFPIKDVTKFRRAVKLFLERYSKT